MYFETVDTIMPINELNQDIGLFVTTVNVGDEHVVILRYHEVI